MACRCCANGSIERPLSMGTRVQRRVLGRTFRSFLRDTFQVNATCLGLALALRAAAAIAQLGPRFDIALRYLVPPLLLSGAPDLLLLTDGALKCCIDIVAASHERWNPVAVVRCE